MAIHSVNFSIVRRSQKQKATFTVAYDRGTKMYDERTGEYSKDYSHKNEVAHSQILVPEDSPEWVQKLATSQYQDGNATSEFLWNKVEQFEKRDDSRIARRVRIALPKELNLEENKNLLNEYLQETFCSQGMIVDYSIHWDNGNPHAHVMLTMRDLTIDGFGKKNRSWDSDKLLKKAREDMAVKTNYYLAKNGHDVRVDHRSNKDRGIELKPNIHLGNDTVRAAEKGIMTDRYLRHQQIKQENYQTIKNNPSLLLNVVGQQKDTFSLHDIASECLKYTPVIDSGMSKSEIASEAEKILKKIVHRNVVFSEQDLARELNLGEIDAQEFVQILATVKTSKNLIYLGIGDDGRDRYTTKACFQQEVEMIEKVELMATSVNHHLDSSIVDGAIERFEKEQGFKLKNEQLRAIKHVTQGSDICIIDGKAGTGKTTVLTPCVEAWHKSGYKTVGVALANVAANNMKECGFDKTTSIFSLIKMIEEYDQPILDKDTVLVVDEASMVGSEDMAKLVSHCLKYETKLVLLGDCGQLYGVKGGVPLRAMKELIGSALLEDIIRQKVDWQVGASISLATGDVETALRAYDEKGNIHFKETDKDTKSALINSWAKDDIDVSKKIIMAHENEDVKDLNARARRVLVAQEIIKNEGALTLALKRERGVYLADIDMGENERISFKKGGYINGVKIANNQMATVVRVKLDMEDKVKSLVISLDGEEQNIILSASDIRDENIEITHAYAVTVHKEQGSTVEKAWCYASNMWDRALTYVAMTRHKLDVQLFASKEKFKDLNELIRNLGKKPIKDSVLDFPYNSAIRHGMNAENLTGIKISFADKVAQASQNVKDYVEEKINPEKYYARKEAEQRLKDNIAKQELKEFEKKQQRDNAKVVRQYLDANQLSGQAWADLKVIAKHKGYWDEANDRADLSRMQNLPEFIEARRLTDNANALADVIITNKDKYEIILRDLGIDQAVLEQKQIESKLFDAISNYKLNKNRLKSATIILDILNSDTRYYPRIIEAELDYKQLKIDEREQQRQNLLETLKGRELQQFRTIEKYDFKLNEAKELRKIYKDLANQHNLTKSIGEIDIANSQSIKVTTKDFNNGKTFVNKFNYAVNPISKQTIGATSVNNINVSIGYHAIDGSINIAKPVLSQKLEEAKQNWISKQEEAEKIAHQVVRISGCDKGMEFYEFENSKQIQELQQKLEDEKNKEEPNQKILDGIEKRINYFVYREEKLQQNASRHQCVIDVLEYKTIKDGYTASKVRANLKEHYHKSYYLCKEQGISWNELLTKAEIYDFDKIKDSLSDEDKQRYQVVLEYVQLTRSKAYSYDDNMELKYAKTKKAHEIFSNIENYKEALEFFNVAVTLDEEKYQKYELNNLKYLEKQSNVYSEAINLIEQYKKETDIDKKYELVEQLKKSPYGSYQEKFLTKALGKESIDFIQIGTLDELTHDTSISYKGYHARLKEFFSENIKDSELIIYKDEKHRNIELTKKINVTEQAPNILTVNNNEQLADENRFKIEIDSSNKTKELLKNIEIPANHLEMLINHKALDNKKNINAFESFAKEQITFADTYQLQEEYTEIQNQRNEFAYDLRKIQQKYGFSEMAYGFYQLIDNNHKIEKLEQQILGSNNISNAKDTAKLQKQIDTLTLRQEYHEKFANIHECHLYINDYQENEINKNASRIRQMFSKDLYGLCYKISTNRNINWNELLTKAEEYDLAKIYPNLSIEQQQNYNVVNSYITLDRMDSSKIDFKEKSKILYRKSQIANEIMNNIDNYKEALEFFQIASSIDDDKLKHEITGFKRLSKESDKYEKTINLINEYNELKKADDEQKTLECVQKLQDKSLVFVKSHYLSEGEHKQTSFNLRADTIRLNLNKEIAKDTHGASFVKEYFEANELTKAAWKVYFKNKDNQELAKTVKDYAIKQSKITNELAYELHQAKDECKDLLDIARIKDESLIKQANKHVKKTEPIHHEYNDETKEAQYSDKEITEFKKERLSVIHGIDRNNKDWQLELEWIIALGKDYQHQDEEIKQNLENDIKWLEEYTEIDKIKNNDIDYEAKRLSNARRTAGQIRDIKGTPAETYLSKRNINIAPPNSKDIGYSEKVYDPFSGEKLPAMVVVSRNSKNDITGCQATFLNDDGTKNTDVKVTKISIGHIQGSGVLIQKGNSDMVALCEGTEDALSIAQANRNLTVFTTLGTSNLDGFEIPQEFATKNILICGDNDGEYAESKSVVSKAVNALAKKGYNIYYTEPHMIDGKKTDFNDISMEETKQYLEDIKLIQPIITHDSMISELKEKNPLEVQANIEIRKELISSIKSGDTDEVLEKIELELSKEDEQIITDNRAELEAYKILAEKHKDSPNMDDSLEELLIKEYKEVDSKKKANDQLDPLFVGFKEQREINKQHSYLAKTIAIINPNNELQDDINKTVNKFEEEREIKLQENRKKEQEHKFEQLKGKVFDIFKKDDIPAKDIVEIYQGLTEVKENVYDRQGEEYEMKEIYKTVAREIQTNPEARKLAKQNNLEEHVNTDAEIKLEGDIITKFYECKKMYDQRNGLMPDITNKEKYKAEVKAEFNMYHLAKVINQDKSLQKDLSIEALDQINELSKQQTELSKNNISHISIRMSKGRKISWNE